jgi:hypothetical protein
MMGYTKGTYMKMIIIVGNVLSVIALAGWALTIWAHILALGHNPTGNSGSTSRALNIIVIFFIILLIVTIVSIIASHIAHARSAVVWAMLPLVLSLGYVTFKGVQSAVYKSESNQIQAEDKAKLDSISKDYLLGGRPIEKSHASTNRFLTYDKVNQEIVLVLAYGDAVVAEVFPFGKVRGDTLEVVIEENAKDSDGYYKEFLDANGKSLFDNYKVMYVAGQKTEEYHLDQYRLEY